MLNYLKKLPYVKYITGFSLVHFYFNDALEDEDERIARVVDYANNNDVYIRGTLPETVLIPNSTHLITIEDDVKPVKAKKSGISEFAILDELLVDQHNSGEAIREQRLDENAHVNTVRTFFDLIIPNNLD